MCNEKSYGLRKRKKEKGNKMETSINQKKDEKRKS